MTPVRQPVRFSTRRSCAILLIGGIIIFIIAYEAVQPLRRHIASRYLLQGDVAFASLRFDDAAAAYNSALSYNKNLTEARERRALAEIAPADIAQARPLLSKLGASEYVARIDEATEPYATAPEAYVTGVHFYEQGEYGLARYALERATSLDVRYPDAWHYLYLSYDKLAAEHVEYRAKAEAAKEQRDRLTARWR